ncbi:unnamed protein product [Eruca vesicaria subsp. sativa]|uniref:J domain-containing protein n=1 Tax=Eruca vesicaria subsp. sativa TaxID=29727 RepID=A0ABC8KR82_ERUVS|nr:unnamed protein product [Eruca vesicaria subsp. sativa]
MQSLGINSAIKLLTYSDELSEGKPLYVSSNGLPVKALNREPAGHSFHSAALKLLCCAEDKKEDSSASPKKDANNNEVEDIPSYETYKNTSTNKGKKKKSGKEQEQLDHYALLGLGSLRYLATEDQIRKSYREAALKLPPDKPSAALLLSDESDEAKQAKKEAIESHLKERLKLIQEAYELLMDPTKRRIFESTYEFDDAVPSDCAPKDFFKV